MMRANNDQWPACCLAYIKMFWTELGAGPRKVYEMIFPHELSAEVANVNFQKDV